MKEQENGGYVVQTQYYLLHADYPDTEPYNEAFKMALAEWRKLVADFGDKHRGLHMRVYEN